MHTFIMTRFLLVLSFIWSSTAMAIEEPKYEVIHKAGEFEIRLYAPTLIAETEVEGDMDQASNKGFRMIADFIFGNNKKPDTQAQEKIAMTAPVSVQPTSAKIAMTAPVTAEPQSTHQDMRTAQKWRIQFVMPSQYTMATLPKPVNPAVQLKEIPSKYFLVHRYSGFNTLSRVQEKTDQTIQWAKDKSLHVIGVPQLSRYDPPWTLPMFRRNEIMLEITQP